MNKEKQIKDMILSLGADVCGIGSIENFKDFPEGFSPLDIWEGCKSIISFGVALPKGLTEVEPRLIYGHFNYELCPTLDKIALTGAKRIEEDFDGVAVPMPSDAPNEYWDEKTMTAKGLISMKHTAVACGIGQMGKSTLLLNPKYGNLLVLGAILTNLDLKSDEPCENICIESCTKCIDSCPVHAIKDGSVIQMLCRKNTYGKTKRNFDTVDCNNCRRFCPMRFGRNADFTQAK